MRCQICKAKTTWDTSMGGENFIICRDCTDKLSVRLGIGKFEAVIFAISDIREKAKKRKESDEREIRNVVEFKERYKEVEKNA